jgi:hypothetical protein
MAAGRTGSRWRRAHALCMARGEADQMPCWRCGGRIDYEFSRLFPQHREAGTVHHVTALLMGGDPCDQDNLVPCHRGCNAVMGNQLRGLLRRAHRRQVPPFIPGSRQW